MNLYDKLKDKETINSIKGDYDKYSLLNALKDKRYLHQVSYYDITTLWWAFNPKSNTIEMQTILDLFND